MWIAGSLSASDPSVVAPLSDHFLVPSSPFRLGKTITTRQLRGSLESLRESPTLKLTSPKTSPPPGLGTRALPPQDWNAILQTNDVRARVDRDHCPGHTCLLCGGFEKCVVAGISLGLQTPRAIFGVGVGFRVLVWRRVGGGAASACAPTTGAVASTWESAARPHA